MFPFIDLGLFKLSVWWLFLFLGYCVATAFGFIFLRYMQKRNALQTQGLPNPKQILILSISVFLSGIFGARVWHIIVNFDKYTPNLFDVFNIFNGGMVSFGGFIGIAIAAFIFSKIVKSDTVKLLDYVFLCLPISDLFRRIGCFLSGCCFGKITTQNFGVFMHADSFAAGRNIFRVPLPMFFALFLMILFILLLMIYHKKYQRGIIIVAYWMIYSFGRFFLEFLRDMHVAFKIGKIGFNVPQIICFVIFLICITVWKLKGYRLKLKNSK